MLMRLALSARPCMVASVAPASSTALRAICAEVTTWRPISVIDEDNSSVPADTVCTLAEVCSAAEATAFTSALDWSAVADMPCAVACMELADFSRPFSAVRTADPAQDAAADRVPDEQHGTDQSEAAERKHDGGRERELLAGLPGRGVGLALHAADQLLHADAKADIDLAGFLEHELAVIVGVQLLLAKFKDTGLALAQRQQFQRCVLERSGRGVLRQQI